MNWEGKESFWFITAHGPFKTSNIIDAEDKSCRFCGQEEESSGHLMFECSGVENLKDESVEAKNYERVVRRIAIELFKWPNVYECVN